MRQSAASYTPFAPPEVIAGGDSLLGASTVCVGWPSSPRKARHFVPHTGQVPCVLNGWVPTAVEMPGSSMAPIAPVPKAFNLHNDPGSLRLRIVLVLLIALAVIAAVVSRDTGIFVPATVNAIAAFWSNGVMANFRDERDAIPNWAAQVSIVTALLSVLFIVLGLVLS